MAKFVVVYKGGSMAETSEEQEAVMKQWMDWFGTLGAAVTDFGNPFSFSTAVSADGSRGETTTGLGGYSILEAEALDQAATLVKGCPVLSTGGSVEIYEAVAM